MRFIDIAYVQEPEGFVARVAAAIAAGEANIGDHSVVWRDCKENLKSASHKKCFYCEMHDSRSDGTVDHYRPKSKYKWAAFRLNNFRFACTFCNSRRTDKATGEVGGKGDDFPLLDENSRATCEAEEVNEYPLLLDPCKAADPIQIDFHTDGSAVPKYTNEADVRKKRAEKSIKSYHLNHSQLTEARRRLAIELSEKISTAQRALPNCTADNAAALELFENAVLDLQRAIKPEAELSVFARRVLQTQRNNPLVDEVLATA